VRHCYEQALTLYRALGNKQYESSMLSRLGAWSAQNGLPQKALERYQQALSVAGAKGDKYGEAEALRNISVLYDQMGKYRQGAAYYGQYLEAMKTANAQR